MIKELIKVCKELKEMFDGNKIIWGDAHVSYKFSELRRMLIWAEETRIEETEELYRELIDSTRDLVNRLETFGILTTTSKQYLDGQLIEQSLNKVNETLRKTQIVRIDNIPMQGNDFDVDKLGQNKIDTFDYKSAYNELLVEVRCLIFKLSYNEGILSEKLNDRIKRIGKISTNAALYKIDIEENTFGNNKIKQYPETPDNCIPKDQWLKQLLEETKEIMEAMQTRMLLIEAEFKRK